jgi:hypothetical protein
VEGIRTGKEQFNRRWTQINADLAGEKQKKELCQCCHKELVIKATEAAFEVLLHLRFRHCIGKLINGPREC